jgi:hypothetical protein
MFPLLMPMLLGAGLGAATNKDPLKGALMGAGMGAVGGTVAPAMGGLFGSQAAPAMTNGAFVGEGVASGVGPWDKAMPGGLFGGDTMKTLGGAANMAQMSGMFQDDPPVMPAPVQPGQGGAAVLAQLSQSAGDPQLQAAEQARKQRRMGLFGVA